MKKKFKFLVYILIYISFMYSCEKNNDSEKLSNDKYDVELRLNDTLKIILNSPMEGYSTKWMNREEVTIIDSINYKIDCNITGKSGCWEIWQFKAVNVGVDTIVLKSVCSCDTDSNLSPLIMSIRVND